MERMENFDNRGRGPGGDCETKSSKAPNTRVRDAVDRAASTARTHIGTATAVVSARTSVPVVSARAASVPAAARTSVAVAVAVDAVVAAMSARPSCYCCRSGPCTATS